MSASTAAIASRIGWSSALRFAGLEIVSRRTPSAGRSRSSSPAMNGREASAGGLLEDHEGVPLVHGLALLAEDLLDGARVLGLDGHLHLHRLEDHDRVALVDLVADLALDLPHRSRDVGLDLRHASSSAARRGQTGTARTLAAVLDVAPQQALRPPVGTASDHGSVGDSGPGAYLARRGHEHFGNGA